MRDIALIAEMKSEVSAALAGVVAAAALSALLSTLQGIYVAALYRYARTEQAPSGMDAGLLAAAFRRRR